MALQKISAFGNRSKATSRALGMETPNPALEEAMRKAMDFILLITKYEKPRYATLPVFSDAELRRLAMPLLVVFGEEDMLLNAPKSLERIQRLAPQATTVLLPGVGHAVLGQAERLMAFL